MWPMRGVGSGGHGAERYGADAMPADAISISSVGPALAPDELRAFFLDLYAGAAPRYRLLAAYRAYISPFEPIARFVPRGARVLDFGCGAGALLTLLAALGRIGYGLGLDTSGAAIAAAGAAAARLGGGKLEFRRIDTVGEVTRERFDVVLMVDVLHHIPVAEQEGAIALVGARAGPGGLFLYKDMAYRPAWRRWANLGHDLLLSRQLVHHVPVERVEAWAARQGLRLEHAEDYARLVYGHQLRVFRKT
jgi:SAM-dependent methyltransferase